MRAHIKKLEKQVFYWKQNSYKSTSYFFILFAFDFLKYSGCFSISLTNSLELYITRNPTLLLHSLVQPIDSLHFDNSKAFDESS